MEGSELSDYLVGAVGRGGDRSWPPRATGPLPEGSLGASLGPRSVMLIPAEAEDDLRGGEQSKAGVSGPVV